MSQHAIQDRPPVTTTPVRHDPLKHARVPRWTPAAIAVGSIAAAVGIGLAAGWHSRVQWGLVAALLFVLATYAITARVEGSRQAKDRVATSLVWVCFVLAVIPLLSLAWVTLSKGLEVLDGYFLSHSMNGVLDAEAGGGVYHALLGTIEQVGIATLIAAPIGLLTAVYLVE